MSAVTTRLPIERNGDQFHARSWVALVKDNVTFLKGWLLMRDSNGYTAAVTAATGYTSGGVAAQDADNTLTGHADGGVTVNAEEGIFLFTMGTAGDAFTDASPPGTPAYGIDNQTLGKTDGTGTRSPVGIFLGLDPDTTTKAFFLVGRQAAAFLTAANPNNALVIGTALTDTATQSITRAGARNWFTVGTISQNSVLTLATTTAQVGDRILITRKDATSAFTYSVANGGAGAGTLIVMPVSKKDSFEAYFDGTNWLPMTYGVQ